MGMPGKKQLEQNTTVSAPAGAVYRLFMDNAELANWAPAVDAVTHEHGGDETGLGATRTCAVTMNGKKGTMVERCVEAVPSARASFLVVDDSFGFTTMSVRPVVARLRRAVMRASAFGWAGQNSPATRSFVRSTANVYCIRSFVPIEKKFTSRAN